MAWSWRGNMQRACRIHVRIDYNFNLPVPPLNLELESGVGGAVYVAGLVMENTTGVM